MITDNGVYVYDIPKLRRVYTRLKVESPGYQTKFLKIKRTLRTRVIVKDTLLSLFTYFIPAPLTIDLLNPDSYKISKKHKEIRVELSPID